MGKLAKYLKKSVLAIIAIIVLLLIQAYCDLALPTYISNIVNVGIQQGGITSGLPDKIRAEQMENLQLFITDDQKKTVNDFYTKDENGDDIYVLKSDISEDDRSKLLDVLGKPMCAVMFLGERSDTTKDLYASLDKITSQLPQDTVPENASFFEIVKALPAQYQQTVMLQLSGNMDKLNDIDQSIIDQITVQFVQREYKEIGVDTDKIQTDYIFVTGVQMIGMALLIVASMICISLLASLVGSKIGRDLRSDVFKRVVSFSNAEYNKFSSASLITRCTNDIQQVQMLIIMMLRMVFYAPILGIGALFKVLNTDASMAWVIGLSVATVLALVIFLFIFVMPKFKILQKLVDKVNLVSREILTGLPVIRAFSREKFEEDRFDKANTDLMKVNLFVNKVMSCMMPVMMLIMNATCVLIVWVGADSIQNGDMQVGNLMAFIQYTMQIIISFLMLSIMSVMLPRAVVSANRIGEVLSTESTVLDSETPKEIGEKVKGVVEFKNVSFAYPGAENEVIKNISFTSKPGETTAIIGSTGSGKSTLLNLIPRFYDVTRGEILLDGINIKNISKKDLRSQIGYVPQKGMLFSGTIESNISFGMKEGDSTQVQHAAEIAQADDFIKEKPLEYKSEIAQGGTNVSGGQRQRLSIARAVAKDPQIYLFDDSFSALDYKTDSALRKALKDATENSTIIIVAQRISTVLNAEKIIVLDDGEIAGIGTHKELLKNCEVYRQIAQSQLSKEELDNE